MYMEFKFPSEEAIGYYYALGVALFIVVYPVIELVRVLFFR